MHDCRQIRAQLPDLVCDELSPPAATSLRAELEACADCQTEHSALIKLLGAFAEARNATQPAEDFWPGYHARLAARLQQDAPPVAHTQTDAAPRILWRAALRRAFTATWRVPAPIAAAVVLALVIVSALALRPASAPIVLAAPPQVESTVVRIVEMPVVQEKIVTRTVYVTRGNGVAQRRGPQLARAGDKGQTRRDRRDAQGPAAARVALTGFKPAEDVRLRIIKGSFRHEQ